MVRSKKLPKNPLLNKFAARYRVAAAVDTVGFTGFSKGTNDGYAAALKVGLAYSALETLEIAVGKRTEPINAPAALKAALRSKEFKPLFELLEEELDNKKLKVSIADFRRRKNSDLRSVAGGIRHLMFHGGFTPYGAGITSSRKRIQTLLTIAACLLEYSDKEFTYWLAETID